MFIRSVFVLACCVAGVVHAAGLTIASWNIERLGHGDQKSYQALALIGAQFDFLAVQEAMTREGLERFKLALEKESGESWQMMYSHLIGRGSYKEKYAFVWKGAKVEYVDGAVVYLDRGNRFAREPYSARFRNRQTGEEFVAATVHILYGKGREDRVPEIQTLRHYWDWLQEVYPDTRMIFLMGDFNLAPSDSAWAPLKEVARPLVTQGATTLSSIDGRFANLYDNIWVPRTAEIMRAGVLDYPRQLGWTHEKSRKHVSDHAPVYARVGAMGHSIAAPAWSTGALAQAAPRTQPQPVTGPARQSADSRGAMEIRGNRNSKIYHMPGCPSYDKVSDKNVVSFTSSAAAEAAGYRRAQNCG